MSNPSTKYPFLDLRKADSRFAQELSDAARRVIESGRYIGGAEVEQLESNLSAKVKAPHVVGVANGLDALRLSLRACVITGLLHEGDEVMVPANTYIASVLAITDAGLTPLLVDPDETTMCLSGETVTRNLTPRTRAIMPVHLYGRVAWDSVMADVVKRNGLIVIEDAAQSLGAIALTHGLFGSKHAGAIGHIGALSFYPTKNVGAVGDAGAVVTHNKEIARTVRALANYGSDYRYHNIYAGFNSRLDPIQAAMINVKLAAEPQITADRFALANTYRNTIRHPQITLPPMNPAVTDCVWHQYVIRCSERDRLRDYLARHGVETDIHYPTPVHRQPCYESLAHMPLPISERLATQVLSLPITPGCTSVKDASEIGQIITDFK